MSKMLYDEDIEDLRIQIRDLEVCDYECVYDEPRWNEFGQCWIMMMEKRDAD